jgi:hypothetical protein
LSASKGANVYQAFMAGYVRRINESTLNVDIGGVRIGSARYTRLAQINLKSRIITFSRFAVEKVPERGRRYLVIHELTHVIEPSHNHRFWDIVGRFEPDYRQVRHELQVAFSRNVREENSNLLLPPGAAASHLLYSGSAESDAAMICCDDELTSCDDDDLGGWASYEPGIVSGGY